jgi:TonB family protein
MLPLVTTEATLGSEFWEDQGVKITQRSGMVFPPSLLRDGVTRGEVRAVLVVDDTGTLADFLVTAFTHPELATALGRNLNLSTFEFKPARQRGQPVSGRFEAKFAFHAQGAVVSLTPVSAINSQLQSTIPERMTEVLASLQELDRPLAAVHQIPPFHPGRSRVPPSGGFVQLDFYIDGNGQPRMPVALRATDEEFAAAAVNALLEWRFEPPTRRGLPVNVRATQDFVFAPDPRQPEPASGNTFSSDG